MHHSISECCCFIGVNEHAGAVPTVNCFVVVYVVDYDVVVFSVARNSNSLDRRRLQTKKVVSVNMQKGMDLGNTAKSFLG